MSSPSMLDRPAAIYTESHSTTQARRLRMAFVITSMPIGGAETLLFNLVQRLPSRQVDPMIVCLKDKGELGVRATDFVPVVDRLIHHKYDLGVLTRLRSLFRKHAVDVVVTVGAGDKMFWGRIAARWAKVPVVCSALHSTGWPDGVSWLNRLLTPITDGFIAVAQQHGRHLREAERFPADRVFVIPNGIDTDRFVYSRSSGENWRQRLGIDREAPVVGIVAALRPEKNHEMFLQVARRIADQVPTSRFVIVGDGPQRENIQRMCQAWSLTDRVTLLGSQLDIPGILSMMDIFALTSHNEASPVSIMEALACERPVVATHVGSVDELVLPNATGLLTPPGNAETCAAACLSLLANPSARRRLGIAGRQVVVRKHSLDSMADGYADLGRRLWLARLGNGTS